MRRLISVLLSMTLVVALGACHKAESSPATTLKEEASTSGPSSVWLVEKDGRKLFLAGTIHLLRKEDYPLPAPFEAAYKQSEKVIFELPPGSDSDVETLTQMQILGSYPQGENITAHIKPETMQKLEEWSKRNQLEVSSFTQMRPWMLALAIAAFEYQRIGAKAENGVDQHFEARAKADGKSGEGLETVQFQLGIFADLSPTLQEELLLQTFAEAENIRNDFDELLGAWRTGDTAKLQEFLFRDAEKYPELMEAFLAKRNKAWIKPLMASLTGQHTAMVLVGAGHMGGQDGLIELLKQQGCTVTQVQTGISNQTP